MLVREPKKRAREMKMLNLNLKKRLMMNLKEKVMRKQRLRVNFYVLDTVAYCREADSMIGSIEEILALSDEQGGADALAAQLFECDMDGMDEKLAGCMDNLDSRVKTLEQAVLSGEGKRMRHRFCIAKSFNTVHTRICLKEEDLRSRSHWFWSRRV